MTTLDTFLERNRVLAAQQSAAGSLMPSLPRALPNANALVIGCADMRVDPAYVLGIKPGEAVVIRNIGGRVTPGTLEMVALLGRIAQVAAAAPGAAGEFHVIVLHHTDCGMTRLGGDPDMLTEYFGVAKQDLAAKAVMDPRRAVAVDVTGLRQAHALPDEWLLSGLVYDVATGLVDIIVPPAPVASAQTMSGTHAG